MLGKGLESLIPPNRSNSGQGNDAQQQPQVQPVQHVQQYPQKPAEPTHSEPVQHAAPSAAYVAEHPADNRPAIVFAPPATPVVHPTPAQQPQAQEHHADHQQLQPFQSQVPMQQPAAQPYQPAQPLAQYQQPQPSSIQPVLSIPPTSIPVTPAMEPVAPSTSKLTADEVFAKAKEKFQQNSEVISGSIYQIEVEKIKPNPNQPRREFNPDAIRDLAASIREFGILQPLVVTKVEKEAANGLDVEYQLIAGERRFMASKLLGLRVVPAIIRKVTLEREKLELAVIENIQRENLNPVETARAFQRLQEEFHLTQREIAAKLGKSREAVANSVRLLDLPPYIQEALQRGDISESHGRLLLAIEDPAAQKKLFDDISIYRLTTRDVKDRVERLKKPYGSTDREDEDLPAEVRAMKDSLSMSLGAPVEIKKGVNTGKISITFYSPEELENILRRLGKENG